jgi:signal transduction histidine kinase
MTIASQLKLPFSTKKKKLYFDLPIAQRLTLGFLLTALIASLLAGGTALTRIRSLHQQSDFYQQLLQTKTTLASGNDLLKLMNIQDEIADISASVNAMLEIIASEQKIMVASELKDQFIASISHELRNPTTFHSFRRNTKRLPFFNACCHAKNYTHFDVH